MQTKKSPTEKNQRKYEAEVFKRKTKEEKIIGNGEWGKEWKK